MKCPACNQDIKLTLPPGLSKKTEAICPKCNAQLNWDRDWKKGIINAVIGAAFMYIFYILVIHNYSYSFAFPIGGAILGLFVGSRRLVKIE